MSACESQVIVSTTQCNLVTVATVGPQGPPGPTYLAPTIVASLGTPLLGSLSMVTDATTTTFASVVSGGGANVVPVYADGFNWRVG